MNDDIYNAFADAYVMETQGQLKADKKSKNTFLKSSLKNKKLSSSKSVKNQAALDTAKGFFGGLERESDLER